MPKRKVGRAATSGHFISIEDANRRPATSVIETVEVSRRTRSPRRRAVRSAAPETPAEKPSKTGKNR